MTDEQLTRYRQLNTELQNGEPSPVATSAVSDVEVLQSIVRRGWLTADTPLLLRSVLERTHFVVMNHPPSNVWNDAVGHFVRIIKTAHEIVQPRSEIGCVNFGGSVILDTLRQSRIIG